MGEYVEYFLFSLINRVVGRLSFRSSQRLGRWLGKSVFAATGFRKEITLENLRNAFPEKSQEEILSIARGAYQNYGIAMLESLWAGQQSAERLKPLVRVVNPEVMARARSEKRGVLLLSAHFGSWELLISSVRLQLETPLCMIVQRQRNKRIDHLFEKNRTRFGNTAFAMGPSSRNVLKALAENQVVLMLGDQSGPKESVFVNFFGRPSATHRGAAAFSLRTGAPIVLGLLFRQQDGAYEFILEEVDRAGLHSSSEESVTELTQRHTAVLEKWIRTRPDHWLWMHKRWKHTPFFEARHLVEANA